ncbi:MAG TPA: hypothetical protein DDW52_10080 [Planctomycetaceae bacterium]|nr:hypothetical protein [Planctomycetaceae bacterium]
MIENPDNIVDTDWEKRTREHFASSAQRAVPPHNTIVVGTVIANSPNGVIVDIGVGIPALLDDLQVEPPPRTDMYPHWTKPIGSKVCAKIGDNSGQFVKLHQWDYDEWGPEFLSQIGKN